MPDKLSDSIAFINPDGSFTRLDEAEKLHIMKALELTMNWSKAARLLGIGRSTLYQKLDQYDLRDYVNELRVSARQAKHEERENIRTSLQITSDTSELCDMLQIDEMTLKKKMAYHGLYFLSAERRLYLAKLAREAEELQILNMLRIAA